MSEESNPLLANKANYTSNDPQPHSDTVLVSKSKPRRELTAIDLISLGVGGIIGTGIFVLTGQAAAKFAGPAIVLSFVLSGIAASFAALCYSEMASMIPVSGSAYTYAYETMGEVVGWIIGWDLILEYLVGAAAVSVGWSGYLTSLLHDSMGLNIDTRWTQAPLIFDTKTQSFIASGSVANIPAMAIILLLATVLVFGIKESTRFNNAMVAVKVSVVVVFIFATLPFVSAKNWEPFIPQNTGKFGEFGFSGILQGATVVFFAYIGFDAVSTTASECKNPQRDLPIGILGSLMLCTGLYILVSFLLTGVVPYNQLNVSMPIAVGVAATGMTWLAVIVEIGAVVGLTTVLFVNLLGQSRILWAISQDGLLPPAFGKIHEKFKTPVFSTVISSVVCALLAGVLPLDVLAELTSVGTLLAFVLVCVGVSILRRRHPNFPRKYRVPGGDYLVPLLGVLFNGLLLFSATWQSLVRLVVWFVIGLCVYFGYGRKHSKQQASHLRTSLSHEKEAELKQS